MLTEIANQLDKHIHNCVYKVYYSKILNNIMNSNRLSRAIYEELLNDVVQEFNNNPKNVIIEFDSDECQSMLLEEILKGHSVLVCGENKNTIPLSKNPYINKLAFINSALDNLYGFKAYLELQTQGIIKSLSTHDSINNHGMVETLESMIHYSQKEGFGYLNTQDICLQNLLVKLLGEEVFIFNNFLILLQNNVKEYWDTHRQEEETNGFGRKEPDYLEQNLTIATKFEEQKLQRLKDIKAYISELNYSLDRAVKDMPQVITLIDKIAYNLLKEQYSKYLSEYPDLFLPKISLHS